MSNNFQSFRFTFEEVCPDVEEIQKFLQSSELTDQHPANLYILEVLPLLHVNSDICGGYSIQSVQSIDAKEGIAVIKNTVLNIGTQVSGYIKEATKMALFLCTAGDEFIRLSNLLNEKGDYMEAYIVDAIGSLTVEKAMDKIQEKLRLSFLDEDLKMSQRYSPGYCNWALSEQETLFRLIGDNPTGISLSKSCLMTPIKSVSGIIGIGKRIKQHEYGCKICQNATCIYRKILHD